MKHSISRRQVLKAAAALGIATQGPTFAFADGKRGKQAGQRSVVLIYLRGGADFLNMIVPRDNSTYELSRPGLAIREDDLIPIDRDWGLHPSLESLKPLYDEKLFAPVVCTGSPHPTRSHFDAQDFMNFGAPGSRVVRRGWQTRYLPATSDAEKGNSEFRAIGMQRLLPTALRGDFPVLAVPDEFDSKHASSVLDRFEKFYGAGGKPKKPESEDSKGEGGSSMGGEREESAELDVVGSGKVTIETLRRFREIVSGTDGTKHGYPPTAFGQGMQYIAQVLLSEERLEAAAIDLNGWDSHAGQGSTGGLQAKRLSELSRAIAAFRRQLGPAFESTQVMVMTEFGRTVRENGSGGTDHGHGSGMFLFGGGLKGGTVHGDWKGLSTNKLYQGRDLPVTTDFRDVIATVLREHLDYKVDRDFFPDYKTKKLSLFR